MSDVVATQVRTAWTPAPRGLMACCELARQQTYLTPSETAGRVNILVNGDFSPEAFGIGVAGVLGSSVTGPLVGWVASLLRKVK